MARRTHIATKNGNKIKSVLKRICQANKNIIQKDVFCAKKEETY